eukprot:NODE_6444_length_1672_cov_2.939806.p1 GENE.NODE_6444_length_1672_cov_2.939806~~NODE_6444_length_1672_cov_2.939806.p1  ORF type:complete len:465 (+),score=154.65 NODE_6444_length_1672_cov_2.939806:113-1396(+)
MDAIAKEVVKKIERFTAQDTSNTAWAFAKLGLAEGPMFDVIAAVVARKADTLQPQNLSIIPWAFAKLGLLNDAMMDALAAEIMVKIKDFDGQGFGNVMWAFGILGVWQHAAMASAVVAHAIAMVDDLAAQEISNIAWGLSLLQHTRLLGQFLTAVVGRFTQVVGIADGSAWSDFANVTAREAEAGNAGPDAPALDVLFRRSVLEPVLGKLLTLRDLSSDLEASIACVQEAIDAAGAPHFGSLYTREVLSRLRIGAPHADEAWPREARRRARETVGGWQIPNTDSIVAFARWSLRRRGDGGRSVEQPGSVFISSWSEDIADPIKELLRPFVQQTRRDMHPERVALLELLSDAVRCLPEDGGPADYGALLASYEGSVQLYVSHYPCISCLAIFCQFLRRLPGAHLDFDYDDAWQVCCGVSRYQDDGGAA